MLPLLQSQKRAWRRILPGITSIICRNTRTVSKDDMYNFFINKTADSSLSIKTVHSNLEKELLPLLFYEDLYLNLVFGMFGNEKG
jgi:hypothetical protein